MFLSDNSGSKRINESIEQKSRIEIKSIYDAYSDIAILKNKITTKDSFITTMQFGGANKEKIKLIKDKWIGV